MTDASDARARQRLSCPASGRPGRAVISGGQDVAASDTAGDDQSLLEFVELLFFAYRDFTSEPDAVLQGLDFGRAHHRVLHFISRQPGLRVADLLDILKITKQSLGPVLKKLVDTGYVRQTTGDADRRERRLHATDAGQELISRLRALQTARVAAALDFANVPGKSPDGVSAGDAARAFLLGMITPAERVAIAARFTPALPPILQSTESAP